MGRGLFITGTDTGVGKTMVAAALAARLRSEGHNVGVMKPVQTGCRRVRGQWRLPDTELLIRAAQVTDPIDLVTPHRFLPPLSPLAAARQARQSISLPRLVAAYRTLARRHATMLVEGSGGLLVPLTARDTMADLAVRLKLPLVIVARAGLGTLNQTMLTVEAARRRGLRIAAIVLNRTTGGRLDASTATNGPLLRELTGIPVIGPLPYRAGLARRGAAGWRAWIRMADASGARRSGRPDSLQGLLRRCGPAPPARR